MIKIRELAKGLWEKVEAQIILLERDIERKMRDKPNLFLREDKCEAYNHNVHLAKFRQLKIVSSRPELKEKECKIDDVWNARGNEDRFKEKA